MVKRKWKYLFVLILPVLIAAGKVVSSSFYDWDKVTAQKIRSGWARNFMKSSTRNLDALEIEAYTLYPGKITHSYLINSHEENLYIVKEGTAEIFMNNVARELQEGGILIASQGNRVVIKNKSSSNLLYYSVRLKPKYVKPVSKSQKKVSGFYMLSDTAKEETTIEGSIRPLLNRPTSVLKNLDIHSITLKTDFNRLEQQTHTEDQIIIVRKGIIFGSLKSKSFRLGKGSLVLLTDDEPREISNGSETQCEYLVIRWATWKQEPKKQ